jgi:hypothetical protein
MEDFMFLMIFTVVHVVLSLIGIVSGMVVVSGLLTRRRLDRWTATFLTTTVATSVTGFGFPFHGFTPAHAVGILSLVFLTLAIAARYRHRLVGHWRWIYVLSATISLYFNVFVLVAQAFQKVPALKAIAPTQSEPPFAVTQLVVLILFVLLAALSVTRFRVEPMRAQIGIANPKTGQIRSTYGKA